MIASIGVSGTYQKINPQESKVKAPKQETLEQKENDRLSQISKKIEDGSYKIDLKSLAQKIAEDLS